MPHAWFDCPADKYNTACHLFEFTMRAESDPLYDGPYIMYINANGAKWASPLIGADYLITVY